MCAIAFQLASTFYLLSDAAPVFDSKVELGNAPRNMQLAQICGASLTRKSTRFSLAAVQTVVNTVTKA